MKKLSKLFMAALAVACILTCLTGCSSGETTNTPESETLTGSISLAG